MWSEADHRSALLWRGRGEVVSLAIATPRRPLGSLRFILKQIQSPTTQLYNATNYLYQSSKVIINCPLSIVDIKVIA